MAIQGNINAAIGTIGGAAVAAKHISNQKEANLEAAESKVDIAKMNKKLGEFKIQQNTKDIEKAKEEYDVASEKQNELQLDVNKAQEAYRKTQDLATYYNEEGERANWESQNANGRAKGELRKQAEESWNLRDETRAQLKDKGYDISKAREALDNQIQVAKGKEFIFNQTKLRREELMYKDKLNSDAITKAKERYKKLGGK